MEDEINDIQTELNEEMIEEMLDENSSKIIEVNENGD